MAGDDVGEFLLATSVLQQVRAYGQSDGELPVDLVRYVDFDESHRAYLESSAGRADAQQWADTFKRTLELLDVLRNAVITDPTSVSVELLEESKTAVARAFSGLKTWIESAPTVAA